MSTHTRRRFRDRWKKRTKKAADCSPVPDCDDCGDCGDCGGCDISILIGLTTLLSAVMGYAATPKVVEGKRFARPLLRLIRSYQRNVSARRPAVCNLSPTCSRFGYETLRDRGLRALPTVRQRLRDCRVAGQQARRAATENPS